MNKLFSLVVILLISQTAFAKIWRVKNHPVFMMSWPERLPQFQAMSFMLYRSQQPPLQQLKSTIQSLLKLPPRGLIQVVFPF